MIDFIIVFSALRFVPVIGALVLIAYVMRRPSEVPAEESRYAGFAPHDRRPYFSRAHLRHAALQKKARQQKHQRMRARVLS